MKSFEHYFTEDIGDPPTHLPNGQPYVPPADPFPPFIRASSVYTDHRDGAKVISTTVKLDEQNIHELPDLSEYITDNSFSVAHNPLTSLKGCPSLIGGAFSCAFTDIENFIGSPRFVESRFSCIGCSKLKSFEGLPQKIGGNFYFGDTPFDTMFPEYRGIASNEQLREMVKRWELTHRYGKDTGDIVNDL